MGLVTDLRGGDAVLLAADLSRPLASLITPSGLAVTDSFNRGDGSLGTADTGQAWSVLLGTAAVSSNRMVWSGLTSGVGLAVLDGGFADGYVQVAFNYPSTNGVNAGVAFRVADSNNLLWVGASHNPAGNSNDRILLQKVQSGTATTLLNNNALASGVVQADTTHTLKVTFDDGGNIEAFIDDVSHLTYTLSSAEQTHFGSNTQVGVRSDSTALTYDDLEGN